MATRKKSRNGSLDEERLRELVETDTSPQAPPSKPHTRRGLLKMAGAALAGAAGAVAMKAVPAAAATGSAVLQGCHNFASLDAPTYLLMAGASPLSEAGAAFIGRSSTGLRGAGYYTSNRAAEIGVLGIAKGATQDATGEGTGVLGLSNQGVGVSGQASSGTGGLFYSATGYDAQLGFPVVGGTVGSGRLAMVGRGDIGGVAPSWAPAFQVTSTFHYTFAHELVRGNDGSIWASRFDASGVPNTKRWKRINAVRTDAADGTGNVFKPFRLADTRLLGPIKAAGNVTAYAVAGQGAGTSSIPPDAIAVMGNLTAAGYTGGGFLTIMPQGITVGVGMQYDPTHDPSSVNFITGQYAIANSFVCGLHNGQLQVYVGGPPLAGHSSHYIIDITAYMQ